MDDFTFLSLFADETDDNQPMDDRGTWNTLDTLFDAVEGE